MSEGGPRSPSRLSSLAVELGLRAMTALFFSAFVVQALHAYLRSERIVLLLLVLAEALNVVLIIIARIPFVRSSRPIDVLVTLVATYYFLFFRFSDGVPLLPSPVPALIQSIGIGLQLYAKYTLGRSFGLLPANRGVVDRGPYRIVRHPIYLSYCIGYLGF